MYLVISHHDENTQSQLVKDRLKKFRFTGYNELLVGVFSNMTEAIQYIKKELECLRGSRGGEITCREWSTKEFFLELHSKVISARYFICEDGFVP